MIENFMNGLTGGFTPYFVTVQQRQKPVRTDGDSYMNILTNGPELINKMMWDLNKPRNNIPTGVSGSTISQIKDRIVADPALAARTTTVIWDGSAIGEYVSVAAYLATIDEILVVTGTTNIVILRPCTFGPSASPIPTQTTLDMEAIYAGIVARGISTFDPIPIINTLNDGSVQDLQDIQARVVCTSCLQGDHVHLLTPAKELIGSTIASTMIAASI